MLGLIDKYPLLPRSLRDPIDQQAKERTGFTVSQALDPSQPIGAALAAARALRNSGRTRRGAGRCRKKLDAAFSRRSPCCSRRLQRRRIHTSGFRDSHSSACIATSPGSQYGIGAGPLVQNARRRTALRASSRRHSGREHSRHSSVGRLRTSDAGARHLQRRRRVCARSLAARMARLRRDDLQSAHAACRRRAQTVSSRLAGARYTLRLPPTPRGNRISSKRFVGTAPYLTGSDVYVFLDGAPNYDQTRTRIGGRCVAHLRIHASPFAMVDWLTHAEFHCALSTHRRSRRS